MLQIQGLVEGLIPVRDTISDRSRGHFDDLLSAADVAISGLRLNSIAVYAKGARTGYRSALPFLASQNRNSSQGSASGPGTFRRLIDYLHSREVRVGAIAHLHRYDLAAWGEDAVWGRDESAKPAQALAAADCAEYRKRLRLTLHEILTLFPDLDFLFLESESFGAEALDAPLRTWLSAKGLSFDALAGELTYDSEIVRTTSALGVRLDPTWSTEGLAFAVDYTRAAMEIAEETFEDLDWKGIRGLVYSPDGPAGRFVPVAATGRWWLVPRIAARPDVAKAMARRRANGHHIVSVRERGRRVCVLLELDPSESPAGEGEAREVAGLARERLDGLLVAAPDGLPAERLVGRIVDEGLIPSRE